MSSIEELNVTALERWMHEVFEEGNLDLAVELMAPSYVGHGPAGTVTHPPGSYLAVIEKMRSNAPGGERKADVCGSITGRAPKPRWSSAWKSSSSTICSIMSSIQSSIGRECSRRHPKTGGG